MSKLNAIDEICEMLQNALESPNEIGTWCYPLGNLDNRRWGIVASWMDYDEGAPMLYAKIASQPLNSIMQCDYDIDWEMPEAYDTEICIGATYSDLDDNDAGWLLNEWEYVKSHFIEEEV